MALSNWACTTNPKNMLVKIVHPGGHVEIHDQPILVADIMLQNPKCCVTHPHVFRQPWAIITPDTMLELGDTFYVVPISTLMKLQKVYMKHSPSPSRRAPVTPNHQHIEHGKWKDSMCCFFTNKFSPKQPHGSLKQTDGESSGSNVSTTSRRSMERRGSDSEESCLPLWNRIQNGLL